MNRVRKVTALVLLLAVESSVLASNAKFLQHLDGQVQAPLTRFDDGTQSVGLEAFRGSFVLLNFWASWCAPCVREMPALDRLAVKLEQKNLVVIAVSQDEGGAPQVKPFLERLKLSKVLIFYDTEMRSFRDFGLRGLPTTVIISPKGTVLARVEGEASWDDLSISSQIEALIETSAEYP